MFEILNFNLNVESFIILEEIGIFVVDFKRLFVGVSNVELSVVFEEILRFSMDVLTKN